MAIKEILACLVGGSEFHTTLGFDPAIWDQNTVTLVLITKFQSRKLMTGQIAVNLIAPINPEVHNCSSPFEHFLQLVHGERSANQHVDTHQKFAKSTWSGL